jgi:hypothetical protein
LGISNIEIQDENAEGEPTSDPDAATTWKRIYDPTQIEDHILKRNITHFGQADGTLFTRQDMLQSFDYEGISNNVTDLIEGRFNYSHFRM